MTEVGVTRRLAVTREGLLPFDPGRDLPAVVELMQVGFEGELEERDRQWLSDLSRLASVAGPVMTWLARWVPPIGASLKGFVWFDGARVVANASIMRGIDGVWVIANVVTAPEYRRRGIATQLVGASIETARALGGREIQLQVRDDNAPAQALYSEMGFRTLFSTAYLRRSAEAAIRPPRPRGGRLEQGAESAEERGTGTAADGPDPGAAAWALVALGGGDRRAVERLVRRADPSGATAATAVREVVERTGRRAALEDWLFGRRSIAFAARAGGELRAVAVARLGADGGPHQAGVVTDPAWRGRVEGEVVRALVNSLDRVASLAVDAEVDAREAAAIDALVAMGFQRRKTLDRLGLILR